jgi:hypothetical protein
VQLQTTAERLRQVGVETLGVLGSAVDRVRFYLRFRPVRCALGADPELTVHQAYGLPRGPLTSEVWGAVESASQRLAQGLGVGTSGTSATDTISRLDGFETTDSELREMERHQTQFTGQFLIDREGMVRWSSIECAREGLAGIDKFPSDEELLEAAKLLER